MKKERSVSGTTTVSSRFETGQDWHLSLEPFFKILISSHHHLIIISSNKLSRISNLFTFIVHTDDLLAKIKLI
jgi:hypothetical protein